MICYSITFVRTNCVLNSVFSIQHNCKRLWEYCVNYFT
jgi:hypothetical protein